MLSAISCASANVSGSGERSVQTLMVSLRNRSSNGMATLALQEMIAEKIEFLIEWIQTNDELTIVEPFHDVVNGLRLVRRIGEHNKPLAIDGRFWRDRGKLRAGNEREDARGEMNAYGFK